MGSESFQRISWEGPILFVLGYFIIRVCYQFDLFSRGAWCEEELWEGSSSFTIELVCVFLVLLLPYDSFASLYNSKGKMLAPLVFLEFLPKITVA